MKATWIVVLVEKPPMHYVYRDGFFPRKFAYKRDAEELVKEVARKGGEAKLEKIK